MTVFTPHQDAALKAVAAWLKAKPGKRHAADVPAVRLCRHRQDHARPPPRRGVDGKVLFAAFTGKAALVMRSKGCERASTIHSLI